MMIQFPSNLTTVWRGIRNLFFLFQLSTDQNYQQSLARWQWYLWNRKNLHDWRKMFFISSIQQSLAFSTGWKIILNPIAVWRGFVSTPFPSVLLFLECFHLELRQDPTMFPCCTRKNVEIIMPASFIWNTSYSTFTQIHPTTIEMKH